MNTGPNYGLVFLTFARNSLVRDMTFRANFIIECLSTITWTMMDLGFYLLIYRFTDNIAGWGKYEFFIFLGTSKLINAIVQAFFMPNCEEVSDLIRTGGLDFAMLKPIDTQFLVSLRKVDWSSLSHGLVGTVLLAISLSNLTQRAEQPLVLAPLAVATYILLLFAGVAIMYSVMIALAATSIWMGQNSSLYDFWFYITNISRYPMEIYTGPWGRPLQMICTFVLPVLVVVNVPAHVLAQPFTDISGKMWWLPTFTLAAAVVCLAASRWVFVRALRSYRSASS